MSNRCPDCNKFATLEFQEPEEQTAEFDEGSGRITAEYRIVRSCADCSTEMKEATLHFDEAMPEDLTEQHQGEGHELTSEFTAEQLEEGGGRYAKSYYGVSLHVAISCSCQKEPVFELDLEDKVAASEMDDMN